MKIDPFEEETQGFIFQMLYLVKIRFKAFQHAEPRVIGTKWQSSLGTGKPDPNLVCLTEKSKSTQLDVGLGIRLHVRARWPKLP